MASFVGGFEHDQVFDVVPMYLSKSDAEIQWDRNHSGLGPATA